MLGIVSFFWLIYFKNTKLICRTEFPRVFFNYRTIVMGIYSTVSSNKFKQFSIYCEISLIAYPTTATRRVLRQNQDMPIRPEHRDLFFLNKICVLKTLVFCRVFWRKVSAFSGFGVFYLFRHSFGGFFCVVL